MNSATPATGKSGMTVSVATRMNVEASVRTGVVWHSKANRALAGCWSTATASGSQQRSDRVAVDILDVRLLEPTSLHDAGDLDSIIAVALVDLHFEHGLGMAWQAKSLKLGP